MSFDRLIADGAAMLNDGGVWFAWLVAVPLAMSAYVVGLVVGVRTGAIDPSCPRTEAAGVALSLGLVILGAGYGAVGSGGASTFTVCIGVIALAVLLGRQRTDLTRVARRSLPIVATGVFLVPVFGVLFGLTAAPSPRDGAQPVEFMDEAYYAALSLRLQANGIESVYAPAGFDRLPGTPIRTWYHWGEIWLNTLTLEVPGITAMHGRHHVVLPLLILASALLAGSLARRLAPHAPPRPTLLMGGFGLLTIAPLPLVSVYHFDWWARPIGFAITQYGLAYVVTLLGLLMIATRRTQTRTAGMSFLMAALAAALIASHALVAATAAAGLLGAGTSRLYRSRYRDDKVGGSVSWRAIGLAAGAAVATVVWGLATGHGLGGGGTVVGISAFDFAWWRATGLAIAGGGVIVVGVAAASVVPAMSGTGRDLVAGAVAAVFAGALVWGLRLPDFNSFHAFYAPLAVILTPVAIASFIGAMAHVRLSSRPLIASVMLVMLGFQGAIGIATTVQRLYEFGPGHYQPIPLETLDAIRSLPADARIAYACAPVEEIAVWDARLISITAHTGRAVVPMCFQVDVFGQQLGVPADLTIPSPFFLIAPQMEIYPTIESRPTPEAVRTFLKSHRIEYVFQDEDHPNTLIPDLELVHQRGAVAIYRIP